MDNFLVDGKAHGEMATQLAASGFNVNQFRTNDVLLQDEWELLDDVIVRAARDRLIGVADLMSRGFVKRLNGMATPTLTWQRQSGIEGASMSMDAQRKGNNDRVTYDTQSIPLPITHYNYNINRRFLDVSRNGTAPLDTEMAALAAEEVAEKIEETLFQGASGYKFFGATLWGYEDHPNRNTVSLSTAWDNAAMTGALILADVQSMIQAQYGAKHYGSGILYIPASWETKMGYDYTTGYPKTIRERILELTAIEEIKIADKLSADTAVLVEMKMSSVHMIEGLQMSNVSFQTGPFTTDFTVLSINVPRILADKSGNTGVTVLS